MLLIPSGTLNMGGDNEQAQQNEFPKHQLKIHSFWMDETEVTNAQFEAFVTATEYVTVAEREIDWEELKKQVPPFTPKPADSLLMPGSLVFKQLKHPVNLNDYSQWWKWTIGANWQHPEGPESDINDKQNHPVVQVAWEDADAYCKWAKKRLPTEAEWEWAARGGKENNIYSWGNENIIDGELKANFWQGLFPVENTEKDGYLTTAPVKSYPANGYGLYDMAGNVWEWCSDWYDSHYYNNKDATKANTAGPKNSYNPNAPYAQEKVIRGGSFLCNDSYCSGYRNSSRMNSSPDTGLNHTGFRCVCEQN